MKPRQNSDMFIQTLTVHLRRNGASEFQGISAMFQSEKTVYHIDRVVRETGEVQDNGLQ